MKQGFCCRRSEASILDCLLNPLNPLLPATIVEETETNSNFPGILNCQLRPVLQHASVSLPDLDEGFNLAILTGKESPLVPHDLEVIRTGYGRRQLSQYEGLYDQLVYLLAILGQYGRMRRWDGPAMSRYHNVDA
jgi:hypothetical protein